MRSRMIPHCRYHLLPAVRGDRSIVSDAARKRAEFERAGGLTRNSRELGNLLAAPRPVPARSPRPWLSGLNCWLCWHTLTTSRWAGG
jgi:hypothetical protein